MQHDLPPRCSYSSVSKLVAPNLTIADHGTKSSILFLPNIPLSSIACFFSDQFLPPTADIYNYIYDASPSPNGGGRGRLDNVIRFYKSWIVKSVRAVTNYEASE